MRVGRLPNGFEVRVAGEGPSALVAEVWHVAPEAHVAHVAVSPRPPESTQPGTPPYWRADVFVRDGAGAELREAGFTGALTDWLLSDTAASKPLLVQFHEARGTHFDMRGGVLDGC